MALEAGHGNAMNSQTAQITQIEAAAMFVRGELAEVALRGTSPTVREGSKKCGALADARANAPEVRECSICELPKPAELFRPIVGRTTTEACGECAELRDGPIPIEPAPKRWRRPRASLVEEFCLRVAMKRAARVNQKFQSAQNDGNYSSYEPGGVARLAAPHFSTQEEAPDSAANDFPMVTAPQPGQQKEKSALAKDPKEYAKWLQTFPDRVAAIVGKTYAVMGDAYEVVEDEALVMIMDLLNAGDDTLIPRNAEKKLARPRKSS
jgi:hypothetical protein